MPKLFSLPYLLATLVVLGVSRACWYYVYLENPYDYYYRYCNVGCATMDEGDENFSQCCLPMTNGTVAPPICKELSDKCAAEGTVCEWGRDIPVSDAPPSEAPSDYVPPPVPKPSAPPPGSTGQAAAPTTSTEVVWVTSTTNAPCETTEEAAPANTSPSPPPPEDTEECVCPPEGTTDQAGAATSSAPAGGEGSGPQDGIPLNGRRGFRKRGDADCVCPTSSAAAQPAPPPPTQPPPPPPEKPEECVCPPEGTTGQAGAATSAAPAGGEGSGPQDGIPLNGRRGLRARGGDCICPSSSVAAEPAPAPPTQTPPTPPEKPEECVCPPEGVTDQAGAATSSAPAGGEGSGPQNGIPLNGRRGLRKRTGDECVCPPPPPPAEEPCECPNPGTTGQAGAPTSSAVGGGEGSGPQQGIHLNGRQFGFRKRGGECVCAPSGGEGSASPHKRSNSARNTPTKIDTPPKRSVTPGENIKRETKPIPVIIATSTSWVTQIDECAAPTAPAGTTGQAGAPTSSAPSGGEGDAYDTNIPLNDPVTKRAFGRWADF